MSDDMSANPGLPVSLREVSVRLGGAPILCDVNLDVEAGEVVGVTGANGSGKTTLLRLIAALVPPAAGVGMVLSARLGTPAALRMRRAVGLVGHRPAVYPELTLGENLRLVCRILGTPANAAVEALAAVGLGGAEDRRAGRCSQGMLRRLDLARIGLCAPRLLLLDEAHTGLDPAATTLVDDAVAATCLRGGAAVVVSHDPVWLSGIATRFVEVADGSLCDREWVAA